jgi:hypothetical protein
MSIDKVICPKCGTENKLEASNCSSCDLPLVSIRNVLLDAESPSAANNQSSDFPSASVMPNLPKFPALELGNFVSSRTTLLDNMGARAEEVRTKFCQKLSMMKIYVGTGTIGNDNFLFVHFPISGQDSYTIIPVRIEAQGDKLLIDRRRYVVVKNSFGTAAWIWIIIFAIFTYGLTLLLLFIKGYREFLYRLDKGKTQETQLLASQTHEITVLSILRDAIMECGGTKEMLPML